MPSRTSPRRDESENRQPRVSRHALHWIRELLGVLVLDFPRYARALSWNIARGDATGAGWMMLRNRNEVLLANPDGPGVRCDWEGTSDLHACQMLPAWGMSIMRRALAQWPIRRSTTPPVTDGPQISVVIPHRGSERSALLIATLQSLFAQKGVAVECIVVEQGPTVELTSLPAGVRHIHLPHPTDRDGWYKSWAYNVGVRAARASIVVCHDGDILVPEDYAAELLRIFAERECEVVFAQRFLFYLSQSHTAAVLRGGGLAKHPPERVVQNWRGGTLAIRRDAFFRIGGFDESFEGWTGEDDEFYDRSLVLAGWRYGYLPFVHLWHSPQPAKFTEQRIRNVEYTNMVLETPRERRVDLLRARQSWINDPTGTHASPARGESHRLPDAARPIATRADEDR